MHVETGDEESVGRWRIDLVVETSILLLARSISYGGGASAGAGGTNLSMPPARGLWGHRGSLPFQPTKTSSSLGERATRRRRRNGSFLLNFIGGTTELDHGGIATTHHLDKYLRGDEFQEEKCEIREVLESSSGWKNWRLECVRFWEVRNDL
jgi:hypothetical protein